MLTRDLFFSILATDAYNRGYNAGLSDGDGNDPDGPGRPGSKIGTATIIADNNSDSARAANSYILACDVPAGGKDIPANSVVIWYRGTDDLANPSLNNDALPGRTIGAGFLTGSPDGLQGQARKAKYGDRWHDTDTEIESSLDSTETPH